MLAATTGLRPVRDSGGQGIHSSFRDEQHVTGACHELSELFTQSPPSSLAMVICEALGAP